MQHTTIGNLIEAMTVIAAPVKAIDQNQELTALGAKIFDDLYTAQIERNHQIAGVPANKYTIGYFGEYVFAAHELSNGRDVNHLFPLDERRGHLNFRDVNDNTITRNVSLTSSDRTRLWLFNERVHTQGHSTLLTMIDRITWEIWHAPRVVWQEVVRNKTTWKQSYQISRRAFQAAGGNITPICDLLREPLSRIM